MSIIRLEDVSRTTLTGTVIQSDAVQRKPIPRMLISECLRLFDVATVITAGSSAYALYVLPGSEFYNRYPGTIVLGALVAMIVAQRLGAYRLEAVFSRPLGAERAFAACGATFGLFLVVAFALKLSEFYSRVWATSWLVSAASLM